MTLLTRTEDVKAWAFVSKQSLGHRIYFLRQETEKVDRFLHQELEKERALMLDDASSGSFNFEIINQDEYEWDGERTMFGAARFRRLMWRSNFVTFWSFWESYFVDIAKELINSVNARRLGGSPGLKLKDFGGGNVIRRCRIVLTRYVGIHDDPSLWGDLTSLAKIRNHIVHGDGYIDWVSDQDQAIPYNQELRRVVDKFRSQGMRIADQGELMITPKMNQYLLTIAEKYLTDILEKCEGHFSAPQDLSK